MKRFLALLALWLLEASSSFSATFYIRAAGDDSSDGTSAEHAWKTIERVNKCDFEPGDRVLFEAGKRFAGILMLTGEDSGSPANPVTIGSFGEGRAEISAGEGSGIWVQDAAHIAIHDLIVTGSGVEQNKQCGVVFDNLSGEAMLEGLELVNLDVSGFGKHGILISGRAYGYKGVRIENCRMHGNLRGGIEVAGRPAWSAREYAHTDVTIKGCQAYENTGDPKYGQSHSGSGIVLYQVDGGRIEHCAAWNNGELCSVSAGGPVGIWTCASRRVVIEYCESFRNKTRGMDGGGFDIDGGSEDCVLQYNYSHENAGPGLMVYTYPYAGYRDRGNVVRFNISRNDGLSGRNHYAGLWVRADGRKMTGLSIYNNTVITEGGQAACIFGADVEATLQNNILVSSTGGVPLRVDSAHEGIKLRNNVYWRGGGAFEVVWNGRSYSALDEWRTSTGQESGGNACFIDPKIAIALKSGTTTPLQFEQLLAFRPENKSILTNGVNISQNTAPPLQDILKTELAKDAFPIGALGIRRD